MPHFKRMRNGDWGVHFPHEEHEPPPPLGVALNITKRDGTVSTTVLITEAERDKFGVTYACAPRAGAKAQKPAAQPTGVHCATCTCVGEAW